jgi:hypothetical protein
MRKQTIFILAIFILGIFILIPNIAMSYSSCGTNCYECNSVTDCNSAISACSEGGTVQVSSGAYTLDSAGDITINKGIVFKAKNSGSVTFNVAWNNGGWSHDGAIRVSESKNYNVEISGFVFQASSGASHTIPIAVLDNSGKPVLIHDNNFISNNYDTRVHILMASRGGVIYSNTFLNNSTDRTKQAIWLVGGPSDWATASTLGIKDANGDRNVYIESNIFNDHIDQAIDMDVDSRTVIRYNTFNDGGFVTHGCTSDQNGPWAPQRPRHFEIYNNTFNFIDGAASGSGYQDYNIFLRSGSGVIHGNTFNTPPGKASVKGWIEDVDRCGVCSAYPCTRQLGRGHDGAGEITEGVYWWNNTGFSYNSNSSITDSYFQSGRDYFSLTKPSYSVYPYPHPLRSGLTGAILQPASPAGLKVIQN